jgi:hypothetical protein
VSAPVTPAWQAKPGRFLAGIMLASVAAGPLVLLPIALAEVARGFDRTEVVGLLFGMVFAVMVGSTVAVLPNVAGAVTLAVLGNRRRWARHPLIWAAAGLVLGCGFGTLLAGKLDPVAVVFGIDGCLCALICRWGTRWTPIPNFIPEGEVR